MRGKPEDLVKVLARKPVALRASLDISPARALPDLAEALAVKALGSLGTTAGAVDVRRFTGNEEHL